MNRTTVRTLVGFLCATALLLAACAPAATPAPSSGAEADVDTSGEEYIYVSMMGNLEFFNAHKYGWKWGGETLGVTTTYVGPPDFDVNAQVAAFDQAIAKKPKGIVVFAVDPSLIPEINKAVEAGIPVVTILGDLPTSKRSTFVGSYQYDLGYVGGTHVAEALGGAGKVAVLSIPGTQMFDDREAGFRAAFEAYPGIEVVQVGDTKADTATAISVAKDILTRNPDLAAFVGTDSTAGIGAATAVSEAGKSGEVLTVSMDRNSDVLQAIQDGTLTGTVAQDDAAMAFWALQVLYNYVHYQAPLTTDNVMANASSGPTMVYMTVNYIDKTNLKYYLDANKLYTE
ncbi:MAG: substrate-binding domain-containing protein [Anaerolineales bacterium]|nr:substrate-binding domain-containing protein [Anaerolineales bacterium]